jgi:cystathionine gamma-synthase
VGDAPRDDGLRFDTRAIHAGPEPDPVHGAINVPVYLTSTYVQPAVGEPPTWDYGRAGNPTRAAFEATVASLEGGARAFAFASGLAAETTVLLTLRPGDHVVVGDDVYGGTYRLLTTVLGPWGLEVDPVDLTDLDAVAASLTDRTRMVWIETPTNPRLRVVDIEAVAAVARAGGATSVVDNTFATPALQRPLELGADVVVHSVTKYLGGHSDLIGGAVVTSDDALAERLAFLTTAVGAVPSPMDCFLALRGVRTLGVRMRRHCDNAAAVAAFLVDHPMVNQVDYPGLPTHPDHEVASRQMRGFGGMVSCSVGDPGRAARIATSTRLFKLAESLGGVESLIELPGPMTHASVAGSPLEVPDDLLRLSVGIEDPEDLVADLAQALDAAG